MFRITILSWILWIIMALQWTQVADWQLFGEEDATVINNVSTFSEGGTVTDENQVCLSSVKIYPNPVGDFIEIETLAGNDEIHYTIYNMLGVQVLYGKLIDRKIELQKLVSGIYNIATFDENEKISHCFIKKWQID